jgi:filamentous hemagglutinin family protein
MARMVIKFCVFTILLFIFLNKVLALPQNGNVVEGSAKITDAAKKTTVKQTTNKAIINWDSFDVGADELVKFAQPGIDSITLNRVIGPNSSQILGQITAPGQVWLINKAGIFFGPNARIDVAGLVATTADIANSDFMAGNYRFTQTPDFEAAKITNQGQITVGNSVKEHGLAVLVAPSVENAGIIQANLGKVVLGAVKSGESFTLDLYGDNLINFAFNPNIVDSKTYPRFVENTGKIIANGGKVLLTAGAASDIVNTVINNSGFIEANAIGNHKGEIVLYAGTEGLAKVTGEIKAKAGTVKVLGKKVEVAKAAPAIIDVSGDSGGGVVLLGGDYQGQGNTPTADVTYFGPNGVINASAIDVGNGGKVIIWSNENTEAYGKIEAKGGEQGGHGGFVETSGRFLRVQNDDGTSLLVDTRAQAGWNTGTWLLDPWNLTISLDSSDNITSSTPYEPSGGNAILNAGELTTALGSSNVIVRTINVGTGTGDIIVAAEVNWTGSNILTLDSYNDININAPIIALNGGLILNANNNINPSAAITVNNFTLQSGTWNQVGSLPAFIVVNDFQINSGATFKRFSGGSGTSESSPYQITDIYGLQGIGSTGMLDKNYIITNNINADVTQFWDSGKGFNPIGNFGSNDFSGTIDGQQYEISNLFITRPSENHVGLFGATKINSKINNVLLKNVNISGNYAVGGLVGTGQGFIENSSISGGSVMGEGYVGGLGGNMIDSASIKKSYANVTVHGNSDRIGGLVGNLESSQIENSYSLGSVSGDDSIGGLVGYANSSNIENSYAAGEVIGVSGVGGLIGTATGSSVNYSYWDIGTSGQPTSAGGIPKTTTQMKQQSTFTGWDFNNIWNIYENNSYPFFRVSPIIQVPLRQEVVTTTTSDIVQERQNYEQGLSTRIQIIPAPAAQVLINYFKPLFDALEDVFETFRLGFNEGQLSYLKSLNKELGIEISFGSVVITREQLTILLNYMLAEQRNIYTLISELGEKTATDILLGMEDFVQNNKSSKDINIRSKIDISDLGSEAPRYLAILRQQGEVIKANLVKAMYLNLGRSRI